MKLNKVKMTINLESTHVGQGSIITFREFLGEQFFNDLYKLKELNANAIVFGFDS